MKRSVTRIFGLIAIAGTCLLLCTIASCGKSGVEAAESEQTDGSGTFRIDGVEYRGTSSVQTFINGNYSIVCEQDAPYKLIQITFHNQAEAEKGGSFKAAEYEMDIPSGKANIGIDGLTFDPEGDYTINVSAKKITLGALKLKQTGTSDRTVSIQSATVSF